jgi:hypothetical protein
LVFRFTATGDEQKQDNNTGKKTHNFKLIVKVTQNHPNGMKSTIDERLKSINGWHFLKKSDKKSACFARLKDRLSCVFSLRCHAKAFLCLPFF